MKIRDRIVDLRRVRAGDLIPNPKNWRTHPRAQQDALRGVLAEVGYVDALLARETPDGLVLIDGHLRAETTPDTVVPVLVVDVSEAEAAKILATFDPLSAMAEADAAKLDELLREVETDSEALAEMLADLAEANGILDKAAKDVVEDQVPELPANPITQPGDLWILGEHRLLCGDSTKSEDVEKVLVGQSPSLQIVDPPFDLDYFAWPLIGNPAVVMVWQRGVQAIKWEASVLAESYGCHELVFVGGVRGWPSGWFSCTIHDVVRMWRGRDARKSFDSSVLKGSGCRTIADGTRPFSVQEHAGGVLTGYGGMSWGKALVAMEIAMSYIKAGQLVYDACAGSGTSLIAAAKHGRVWRGVENQPKWCDLIATRYRDQCGGTAERIAAQSNAKYNAGRAAVVATATPKHRRTKKESAHV